LLSKKELDLPELFSTILESYQLVKEKHFKDQIKINDLTEQLEDEKKKISYDPNVSFNNNNDSSFHKSPEKELKKKKMASLLNPNKKRRIAKGVKFE
jgi:hypothetical protein